MKLKITIDSKVYEVDVEAAEPEPVVPAGYTFTPATVRVPAGQPSAAKPAADSGPVDEDKVCRSPISGIVVKVNVQEGQQIKVGDTLFVLEAMKMETAITAPVDGKITKIRVNPGDGVQGGQILVEFE